MNHWNRIQEALLKLETMLGPQSEPELSYPLDDSVETTHAAKMNTCSMIDFTGVALANSPKSANA